MNSKTHDWAERTAKVDHRRPRKVAGGLVILAGVTLLVGCGSSKPPGAVSPASPTTAEAPVATPGSSSSAAPTTAPPPSTSTAETASVPCLVGSWVSTGETEQGKSVGGAGQTFVFKSDGTGTQSYDGSAPLVGMTWKGSAAGHYTLTPNSPTATSGSIDLSYVAGNVTANGTAIPLAPAKFDWSCLGGSAQLSVTNAVGLVTVNLQRR